jgi:hypothetical protein
MVELERALRLLREIERNLERMKWAGTALALTREVIQLLETEEDR